MKQFILELNKDYQRPIVQLETRYGIEVLLDTGAYFPVWTASEELLVAIGSELVTKGITFGGFGGTTVGNLYKLKVFEFGDLVFPDMPIIACSDMGSVPFYMILSATMFSDLIYEIDDKNHKLSITVPNDESIVRNLVIKDSKGGLHVCCTSGNLVESETTDRAVSGNSIYDGGISCLKSF